MVERAVMSIINKMHQGLKDNREDSPILSSIPAKKQKKRVLLFVLISLLLASSIGLSYLVYDKENAKKQVLNMAEKDITSPELSLTPASQSVNVVKNIETTKVVEAPNLKTEPDVAVDSTNTVQLQSPPIDPAIKTPIAKTQSIPIDADVLAPVAKKQSTPTAVVIASPIVKTQTVKKQATPKQVATVSKKVIKAGANEKPKNKTDVKKGSHLEIKKSILTRSQWADIHLKKAEKALLKGDMQLATEEKIKALSLKPDLHDVRQSLALYYYSIGEQEQSKRLLKKGAMQFPGYSDFNLMLSRIALKSGDKQKAYLYLQQSPPEIEGHIDYHVSYAVLAQKFKHYDRSEKLYKGLLTQRPDNGRWRMALAIAQDKLGKKASAIESYKKALSQIDLSSNAKAYINQRLTYLANQ